MGARRDADSRSCGRRARRGRCLGRGGSLESLGSLVSIGSKAGIAAKRQTKHRGKTRNQASRQNRKPKHRGKTRQNRNRARHFRNRARHFRNRARHFRIGARHLAARSGQETAALIATATRLGFASGHTPHSLASATTRGRVGYGERGTSPRRNAAVPNCGVLRLRRGGSGGDGKRPSLKRGGCDRQETSPKMRRKVGPLVSFRLARW